MRKIAIFVEGQTELIFVRESLLKIFDYQNIGLDCFNSLTDGNFNSTDYSYPVNENCKIYFQVVNVGGDNAVLSRILSREESLRVSGFDQIIGLRDMYSQNYREVAKDRKVNKDLNESFKNALQERINEQAQFPESIHFYFAIMEIEAWFLGCDDLFKKIDIRLTSTFIEEQLGIDLKVIDPETTFFHPANEVKRIYALVEKDYQKGSSLVNNITKNDLELLDLNKKKCASFSAFYQLITKLREAIL